MRLHAWLAGLLVSVCHAQMTPLRLIVTPPKSRSISILGIRLQELKFGHEGPSYFSVEHAPYRGKPAIVEVSLFGQDAIRTVQFELIDQSGQRLASPVAFRTGDGADADEYLLLVDVPVQPFRFGIRGEDFQGQPYESIDKRLFSPINGNAAPSELLPGLPPDQVAIFQKMMDGYAQEVQAQFDAARKTYPDGVIRLPRSEVVGVGYEPLRSAAGNEIGLRLHVAVRFGADGAYSVAPHMSPQYRTSDWREISLKVLDARVTPAPVNTAADGLDDVLRYGGAAQYQANQVYQFQFDLTPTYIIRNSAGTRYCIYTEGFRAASRLAVWEAVQANTVPVKYRVDISSLDFLAETTELPVQRTYLDNFRREGAQDCGPSSTNRF